MSMQRPRTGNTPLHYAATNGRTEIVDELTLRDACINAQDKNGETPLHLASRHARTETARMLIQARR